MKKLLLIATLLIFSCVLTFESVNAAEGYTPPQKFTRTFVNKAKDNSFFNNKNQRQNHRNQSRNKTTTAADEEERTASMEKTSNPDQKPAKVRKPRHSSSSPQNRPYQRRAAQNTANNNVNN